MIHEPWTANDLPVHSEVFQVVTLSPDTFVNTSIAAKGILQSRDKERTLSGKVNCSLPFTSPDGRACLAVGCAEGLWIGYRTFVVTALRRVSDLKMITQCAMLEESGIFLILANKMLFAYDIESLVPSSCLQKANTFHIPQKLNGSLDVQFFSVGSLEGRTLVIYMTKKGLNSVFRVLEPVVVSKINQGGPLNSQLDMWKSRSRGFRIYRDFSIPSKAYNVVFLGARIAILCKKGFKIMDLSDSQCVTIPHLHDPRHKKLAKRCRSSHPMGLFRS
ncbi:CNH domain-containing protein, partial [Russula emetica]